MARASRDTSLPLQSRGPQPRHRDAGAGPASTGRVVRPGSTARHSDLHTSPLGGGRGAGPVNSEQPARRSDASQSRTPRRLRGREALYFPAGRS